MYRRLCDLTSAHVDRCVLYVFRCAVYFASNEAHDPELLKWWNWSDQRMTVRDQVKA
jgi:Pathogenicity locus